MFVVPIDVMSETDLYEPFDPTKRSLSTELRDYLESYVEDREVGQNVRLELTCAAPIDADRFEAAYRAYIDTLARRCKTRRARKTANAIRLLAIGAAFVVAGVALSGKVGPVPAAIISTVGSFSIWEAAAIWLEDLPALRKRELALGTHRRAEVLVCERKPNYDEG